MSIAPIRTLKRGGGALITYYDGSTVLGERRVAKGKDVLHPAITMPSKSDKTFVGWATSNSESAWVGTLVATGEPMSLYAIYLDNTRTISNVCPLSATATWNSQFRDGTFNVDKSRYADGTITAYVSFSKQDTGELVVGSASLDGVEFGRSTGGSSGSRTITATNGTHSLHLYVISYDNYPQYGSTSATISLSNPIAWT